MKLARVLLAVAVLSGCSGNGVRQQADQARTLASAAGLVSMPVETFLPIQVYGRFNAPDEPVHVYIEGDGRAWRNARQPSLDPTPHDPVALKLAAADQAANVLYVARPCQYLNDPARGCQFKVWTEQRFAHADQLQQAIEQLTGYDRKKVLVGFSGGANLAVQLAARMPSVIGIITVAGNLDAIGFAHFHQLPSEGYGHNAALLAKLRNVPQLHYSGSEDLVIPPQLTRRMLGAVINSPCVGTQAVAGATHSGPWRIDWEVFGEKQAACMQKIRDR
jgi:pimeloyl-ACP methyl ester carboxylesterase